MLCKEKCRDCSYLTCNFHPLFYLTRQQVNPKELSTVKRNRI